MARTRRKNISLLVAMAQKRVTAQRLAELAGVHRATVSRLLNERQDPTRSTAVALADALGTTPAELWPDCEVCREVQ